MCYRTFRTSVLIYVIVEIVTKLPIPVNISNIATLILKKLTFGCSPVPVILIIPASVFHCILPLKLPAQLTYLSCVVERAYVRC
jgi:hypothetical protein